MWRTRLVDVASSFWKAGERADLSLWVLHQGYTQGLVLFQYYHLCGVLESVTLKPTGKGRNLLQTWQTQR